MAKRMYFLVKSFGSGIFSLGKGWNWSHRSVSARRRSVDYYFARVGERLIRARRKFEDQYLGASDNVNV